MKISVQKVLTMLDEKYLLADKRKNYDVMTTIADLKSQVLHQAEKDN